MSSFRRSAILPEPRPRLGHLDALLDDLADRVAERIVERVGLGEQASNRSAYYSAKNNPLGSQRAFLDAARRGDFPSYKAGRRVLARCEDVDRWIESRPRKHSEPPADEVSDRALLEGAGVRLRGKGRR